MTRRLLMVCAMAIGSIVTADELPHMALKITTKRDTDRVDIDFKSGKAAISIRSPFGISQAVINRAEKTWPAAVTLKLYLQGLESLRISNGKVTLHAAVSSSEIKPLPRIWKDNAENVLLDDKSPYWLDLRMIGSDGKPADAIPLKDGYFEITIPKRLIEGNPQSITVDWIDFYRT